MNTTAPDPTLAARTGLGLACCSHCPGAPCEDLRFGGVWPAKFELVHRTRFSSTALECPFFERSWRMIERELGRCGLSKLNRLVSCLISDLSAMERIRYDQRHFVNGYTDTAGRIELIRTLCSGGVVSMIRVPDSYEFDPVLKRWLSVFESPPELRMTIKKTEDDGPAVTDGMTQTKTQTKEEKHTLRVRLNIDPNDKKTEDDTFTLFSTDGAKTYNQVLTIKGDKVPGDKYLDLDFEDCPTELSYTLEVDPGKEGSKYRVFEKTPFKELTNG
jgi:hypothetical protein